MISINSLKLTSIFGAVIISLLSACGGGGGTGDGSTSGFTASNATNTKPQTSSIDSTASSSAESSSSSTLNSTSSISSISASQVSLASSSSTSSTSTSSSSSNSSVRKVIIDTAAPSIVSELSLTFTEYDLVVFSWAAATDNVGVTAYKIYRNQIQIDQIDAIDLTYADFNVAPNSSYTYGVSAGDAVGNWSPIKTILAKTQAQPVPPSSASSSSLSSKSSSSNSSSISLSSTSSSSSSSTKSSSSSTSSISLSSTSSSSSSSTKSSSSSTSSISLSSTSSSSNLSSTSSSSRSSSSLSAVDTTPPSTPSSLYEINTSAAQVDIGWTAATDNIGITAYKVYRDNILIGTLGASTLEYSDKTTAPNKLYTYSVEAGDAAGNWSPTRKTIFITTPAAASSGDVTLYWAPPTQREDGTSITEAELGGFLIRYKLKAATDYTLITINDSSVKSRIIANLIGDYEFQIATYDSNNLYSTFATLFPK